MAQLLKADRSKVLTLSSINSYNLSPFLCRFPIIQISKPNALPFSHPLFLPPPLHFTDHPRLHLLLPAGPSPPHPPPPHHKTTNYHPPPAAGGGIPAITPPPAVKCSLDILKLGLCLNVLGGLVQVGLAPVEIYCCPVIEGLLELEAAACLCAAIDLKVLNLNIYIPLALQVLIACGKDPPPGYFCPLLY
ncbi:hypothetical protein KFK09_017995 [Dendrobium nobile]|uniref:Hydrophobic seed protein domain-containing protein n=1 Tax=Dendrobium nobile TaxID=94219 RepID=A0A8T3AUK2_DENNO|nr:hypothetical protein KFK09_017995 [Dendrobium nobile]